MILIWVSVLTLYQVGLEGPAEVAVNFGATIFVHNHKIFNKIVESVETVKRFSSQRFSSHIATDKVTIL